MMQLAHRPAQPCRTHEAATRLQPMQLAAQLPLVMLVHRLLDRVAHAGQLGQEQFSQRDQVVALAIECGQCRSLVPVLHLQLDRCRGLGHEDSRRTVHQCPAHRLQQLVAAQRFDQGVAETGFAQAGMNGGVAVGGMRQRRGIGV
ncbi:hypothetical protein G6F59_015576 [Rhizopus arrhizus]|nr:hypothetical protein G6F59_015576 [Rhizopus arrhizus]